MKDTLHCHSSLYHKMASLGEQHLRNIGTVNREDQGEMLRECLSLSIHQRRGAHKGDCFQWRCRK